MRNVLADLAVESEAATTLGAAAGRRGRPGDPRRRGRAAFRRIATAIGKYWVTKRAPAFTAEALECLGGNGYVEDSGMPRLYREAPLNSVWEGSGNVNALDVLRALGREPGRPPTRCSRARRARGADRRLDAAVDRLAAELGDLEQIELRARRLVELMALALQGSLLVRHAPARWPTRSARAASAATAASRSARCRAAPNVGAILERALPDGLATGSGE